MKKIYLVLIILVIFLIIFFGGRRMKKTVVFETTMGNFEVELYSDKAPITVANFLSYVKDGFYNGLIFHRVIDGFMIQGGGFDINMQQKQTKPPIKNEADNGLKNLKYTLAMARTGEINSATSQFFINTADNSFLDHGTRDFGYAVFGKVISGFDVINRISKVKTTTKGDFENVPLQAIVINKVYAK
jgi:peptidyl-prolyl cis-trans isomerase A (cyclophilin A)